MHREVFFLRHAKKQKEKDVPDMELDIVPGAIDELRGKLKDVTLLSGQPIFRHSKYKRARKTAEGIAANGKEFGVDDGVVEEDPDLGIDMRQMFSEHQLNVVWKEPKPEDELVHQYLVHGREKPDDNTWSPYRIACALANSLIKSVFEAEKDDERGEERTEFKVTHSSYVEALLEHLAGEQIEQDPVRAGQSRFVDKMGGILEMGELGVSFEINGTLSEPEIVLKCRGKAYKIDHKKLLEMSVEHGGFEA